MVNFLNPERVAVWYAIRFSHYTDLGRVDSLNTQGQCAILSISAHGVPRTSYDIVVLVKCYPKSSTFV